MFRYTCKQDRQKHGEGFLRCKKAQQILLRIETKKHRFRYNCKQDIRNMVKDSGMQKTKAKAKEELLRNKTENQAKTAPVYFSMLCAPQEAVAVCM
jgi:hypothetical protein